VQSKKNRYHQIFLKYYLGLKRKMLFKAVFVKKLFIGLEKVGRNVVIQPTSKSCPLLVSKSAGKICVKYKHLRKSLW